MIEVGDHVTVIDTSIFSGEVIQIDEDEYTVQAFGTNEEKICSESQLLKHVF